jgi:5-dehydro-2-deoxygluconokinase
MKKLKNLGAKISVVTDGITGSYAIDKDGTIYKIGVASEQKPIERTGAGDSYASGFLYGMLLEKRVEESMKYGAINAESVIREIGAQKGLLTKEEIEQKSKENLGLIAVRI